MGVVSTVWFIAIELLSPDNVLGDSVTALGFGIAFYYGITGFACVVFYRRELSKSDFKTFFYAGVLPLVGALALFGIFIKSFIDYSNPDKTNTAFLGVGPPVVIGVGSLLLGVVVMFFARFRYREFFRRKPEVFDPATAGQAPRCRRRRSEMANVIVVGYDGAEGAKAALEESLRLCGDLGAELVAVFGYGMPIPERQSADYRETLQELGERDAPRPSSARSRAGVSGPRSWSERAARRW